MSVGIWKIKFLDNIRRVNILQNFQIFTYWRPFSQKIFIYHYSTHQTLLLGGLQYPRTWYPIIFQKFSPIPIHTLSENPQTYTHSWLKTKNMKHFYRSISMIMGFRLSEFFIFASNLPRSCRGQNMRIFQISFLWYVSTQLLKSKIIFCKTGF